MTSSLQLEVYSLSRRLRQQPSLIPLKTELGKVQEHSGRPSLHILSNVRTIVSDYYKTHLDIAE